MRVEKPIQPVFSFNFQAKYCLTMMAGSIVTSVLLYLALDQGLGESYFESLMTLNTLEQTVPTYLAITFVIQLGLIVLITFTIHLFVSHKIAGPVYRYELTLASLLKNDFRGDVRTRQGDQLKPMVGALNSYIEKNRYLYATAQLLADEIGQQIESGLPVDNTQILGLVQRIRQTMHQADEEVSS